MVASETPDTNRKPSSGTILVVDDNPNNLRLLYDELTQNGYKVKSAINGPLALKWLEKKKPDLILLDIRMQEMDGYEVCQRIKSDDSTRDIPIIFISALLNIEDKVNAFKAGGVDYVTKPFQNEEILARIQTHISLKKLIDRVEAQNIRLRHEIREREKAEVALQKTNRELEERVAERTAHLKRLKEQIEADYCYLREEIKLEHDFEDIIGQSTPLKQVLSRVELVAPTDATVLIQGETGTGKELIARAIHNASLRKDRALIKVNCATLPANLIESELFGHEKGAFTGAQVRQVGRFELANGATLFLDEIGELPMDLQPKLLRVLQDREFERLGGGRTIQTDVRVIAATNRDLENEVRQNRFRSDLWYRLNVVPITVPPLRERKPDIPLLVQWFVDKFAKQLGKPIQRVSSQAINKLKQHDWPGNVRELEHVIERAVIHTKGTVLNLMDDPVGIFVNTGVRHGKSLADIERDHIVHILEETEWKIQGEQGAAALLDLHPSTLRSKMKKLCIQRP